MKKIEICLAAVLLCFQLSAQVEKGKVLLGATVPVAGGLETMFVRAERSTAGLSYASYNYAGHKSNLITLGLSPRVGYAVMDNLLVSMGVGISSLSMGVEDGGDRSRYSSFSVEPQVRYYFLGAKAVPFVEAGGTMGQLSSSESANKDNFRAVSAGAGLAIFLNPATSIDIALRFQAGSNGDIDDEHKTKLTTFGLNIGFSWFLK